MGAHAKHARHDPAEATQAATEGMLAKFEAEVDPDGALDPDERRRRAIHARKAYMAELSLKAAKARRLRAEADRLEAEAGGAK